MFAIEFPNQMMGPILREKKYRFLIFLLVAIPTFTIQAQRLDVHFKIKDIALDSGIHPIEPHQEFASRAELNIALDTFLEQLGEQGYLSARAKEQQLTTMNGVTELFIQIDPGQRWEHLVFSTDQKLEHYLKDLLDPVDKTKRNQWGDSPEMMDKTVYEIDLEKIPELLSELSQRIAEDYSPFSDLRFVHLGPLDYPVLRGKLAVNWLPLRTIDSLVIKGYPKIDRGLIKHRAGLKLPVTFEAKKIMKAESALSTLPYIDITRPSETLFESDRTTLYIYPQKTQANQIDGILGFGTNPQTNRLQFNGFLNLQLLNNFDQSESLELRYKGDGAQQQRLEVFAEVPYLFNSPFGFKSSLDVFRRDSTFTNANTSIKLTYHPFGPLQLAMGYTSINSSANATELNATADDLANYNQNLWAIEVQAQQRNRSKLMPWRYRFKIMNEFGSSDIDPSSSNTNNSVPISFKRNKLELDLVYLWDLWSNHHLYLRHHTAWLEGQNLLLNELFRFGGTQSLRGFNENLIESSQIHLFNTEYRLAFNRGFYLHHLTDFAIYRSPDSSRLQQNYSLGLGIAALTRAGLLKLQLAQGFGQRTDFSSNNTKIHLVFSTAF